MGVALCAALAPGCARTTLVLPVTLAPAAPTKPAPTRPLRTYESAVNVIAAIMVSDLALPLPSRFTVFVFPTRAAYAGGLANTGLMPASRAAEIAEYSVGLGHHRQLFLNDGALRGACGSTWLAVLTHELTHSAQYELSGGRRGRSEQWIREGMAAWVAYRVLDRLGEATFGDQRERAAREVVGAWRALQDRGLDLVDLGRPRGWEARHRRPGGQAQYRLAFLLTDELIRRGGWERLLEYFRAFAGSDDRFGNFDRAFGLSLDEFERQALESLGHQYAGRDPTGITAPRARDVSGEFPVIGNADPCPVDSD
ncbi:MAG: hypothetical protein HYV94_21145 [Candidatus Rokubacteria bacterium]|nr:hypothetical protein [Candidatus Rokubacteria bacterium]